MPATPAARLPQSAAACAHDADALVAAFEASGSYRDPGTNGIDHEKSAGWCECGSDLPEAPAYF